MENYKIEENVFWQPQQVVHGGGDGVEQLQSSPLFWSSSDSGRLDHLPQRKAPAARLVNRSCYLGSAGPEFQDTRSKDLVVACQQSFLSIFISVGW